MGILGKRLPILVSASRSLTDTFFLPCVRRSAGSSMTSRTRAPSSPSQTPSRSAWTSLWTCSGTRTHRHPASRTRRCSMSSFRLPHFYHAYLINVTCSIWRRFRSTASPGACNRSICHHAITRGPVVAQRSCFGLTQVLPCRGKLDELSGRASPEPRNRRDPFGRGFHHSSAPYYRRADCRRCALIVG